MVFSCVKYWKDYTQSVVKDGSMVFTWWSNIKIQARAHALKMGFLG
jgi:hypothetical protein